jgi:5-hydroxyisourate hydrolase-like protein (transthyretin family)
LLITLNLFATVFLKNKQKYIMTKDVVGDYSQYEHYFEMGNVSRSVLDGSENYYSVSFNWPIPPGNDAFGLKMSGANAKNDTIRRVYFTHCGAGIYIRGWGGGGGLIDDCRFIENKGWGARSGQTDNFGIEISNCRFQHNNNGLAVKTADSMWVHDNRFMADSSRGLSLDGSSAGVARYNLIENNYFTGHENEGIEVINGASDNTIRKNYLDNDPIRVVGANNNLFIGNFIKDCELAIALDNCKGNIFESDTVENSDNHVQLRNGAEVHFITSVFDTQKVQFLDNLSKLFLSWYLNVTVTGSGPVEGAIVQCYNNSNTLIAQSVTDSDGKTKKMALPQTAIDSSSSVTYNPYRIVISKEGYFNDTTIVNINEHTLLAVGLTSGIKGGKQISSPDQFVLRQNYPNPFNPNTYISYYLPKPCMVSLKIYDIQGKIVRTLVNKFESRGQKSIDWDSKNESGKEVTSGVYIYSILAGNYVERKRMVLIK